MPTSTEWRSARAVLCQQACPQPRNASSACWLSCFYEAILGPRAGREVRLYPQAAATSSNAWGILVSKHANGSISPVITVPCPRPPPLSSTSSCTPFTQISGGSPAQRGGGLSRAQLLAMWAQPFDTDDPTLGGCADISADTSH